jgi:hypothetical protein
MSSPAPCIDRFIHPAIFFAELSKYSRMNI